MTRQCQITGKKPMAGNNVSHANNKTRRRFLPNLQETRVYSETLKRFERLRVSIHGLRTLEHKGGLDAFVMDTAPSKLDPALRKLRAEITKVKAKSAA